MTSRVLVAGSGAVGLRTALELLRSNVRVVVRSPHHPLHPSTCSMGAGGLWMPYHIKNDQRTDRWAIETLDEIYPMAKDPENALVEIVPTVILQRKNKNPTVLVDPEQREDAEDSFLVPPPTSPSSSPSKQLPNWTNDVRIHFQQMTVEMLFWQNHVHKLRIPPEEEIKGAGYLHCQLFQLPVVDAPRMLENMLQEIAEHPLADIDVDTGETYESVQHLQDVAARYDCNAVVNCTGLGAAKVCNDQNVKGGRGVLLQYDRSTCQRRKILEEGPCGPLHHDAILMTEEGPWGNEREPCYMIPRGDRLLVGGTFLVDDTKQKIRTRERERLLQNAYNLGIDIQSSVPVNEWVGFRPYPLNERLRCEFEPNHSESSGSSSSNSNDSIPVVHSYGHSGSGWTINVGTAKEVFNLLRPLLKI